MYNDILISISSLINVIGTVYAVLSILGISITSVYSSITLEGMDEADKNLMVQKKQAVTGIPLVVLGWIFQTLFTFLQVTSLPEFIFFVVIIIVFFILEILITHFINVKFQKKYDEFKRADTKETHKSAHEWGNW